MTAPASPPTAPSTVAALQAVAARVLDAQRNAMTAVGEIELAHFDALPEIARVRALVAVTLLKASCDVGLAASTLLATSLEDFVAAALALHRTQIETYARGVFFKSAATDAELRRFVERDEMPKRLRSNGRRSTITTAEVLQAAAHVEDMDAAKLQGMMDNVWAGLCGVVHGGRPLLQTYRTVDTIGASLDSRAVRALLGNLGALTILACTGICAVGDNGSDQQAILARIKAASDTIATAAGIAA